MTSGLLRRGWLGSGEAANLKTEEGVRIRVHADLGIGSTRLGACKTFVVDPDVHGLYRTNLLIEDIGYCHGIEERRRLLAPLVVEKRQGIRERSSLLE